MLRLFDADHKCDKTEGQNNHSIISASTACWFVTLQQATTK